ncbi:MAG TPA: sugar phosphate isomerase/epimerase [Pirellulales bacterium]|jgi:sugar phosphate isomerase/epimerase
MLSQSIAAAGLAAMAQTAAAAETPSQPLFAIALNTSTIRGQKLPLAAEIEIAARAGFQGIEPWINEIDEHVRSGGSAADLRKRFADAGLKVAGVIAFAEWIVDDDARRAKGLEEAKRVMDLTAEIGGKHIAAPPAGVSQADELGMRKIADRYRALLELGEMRGITPQLELWGFAKVLNKLSDVVAVAIETGHPHACVLADSYHLYKGGSDYESLRLVSGDALHVFHINDYPANPPRAEINDAARIFPGDGVAPLHVLFKALHGNGFQGMLSLELFNREYWTQDALQVARMGYEKTRAAIQASFA